jgi:membrane-bound ClpP family serine protease
MIQLALNIAAFMFLAWVAYVVGMLLIAFAFTKAGKLIYSAIGAFALVVLFMWWA